MQIRMLVREQDRAGLTCSVWHEGDDVGDTGDSEAIGAGLGYLLTRHKIDVGTARSQSAGTTRNPRLARAGSSGPLMLTRKRGRWRVSRYFTPAASPSKTSKDTAVIRPIATVVTVRVALTMRDVVSLERFWRTAAIPVPTIRNPNTTHTMAVTTEPTVGRERAGGRARRIARANDQHGDDIGEHGPTEGDHQQLRVRPTKRGEERLGPLLRGPIFGLGCLAGHDF